MLTPAGHHVQALAGDLASTHSGASWAQLSAQCWAFVDMFPPRAYSLKYLLLFTVDSQHKLQRPLLIM